MLCYDSYKDMAAAYSKQFGRNISTSAIKARARRLKIKKPRVNCRHFTPEQIEWLKIHYPKLGCGECVRQINKRFDETRTFHRMKNFGQQYGITVKTDVAIKNRIRAAHSIGSKRAIKEVGTKRIECGRIVIKGDDGQWHLANRYIYEKHNGEIPKGYAVIYLDGDVSNNSPDNLAAVKWKYLGLMQKYGLRSENKVITETSVKWCELYDVFQTSKREHEER